MKAFKKGVKKNLLLIVVLVVAGFTGWIYLSSQQLKVTTFDQCVAAGYSVMESFPPQCQTPDGKTFMQDVKTPEEKPNKVRIKGEIVCLPHKDTEGPQTLECAYGLKSREDGKYYALGYSDPDALHMTSLPTGEVVVIEGNLSEQPDSKYDIVGAIEVTSVEK